MAINYVKTVWVNGQSPALNASNLNKIEGGIKAAADGCDVLDAEVGEINDTLDSYGNVVTRNITASETDITAGTTPLTTGDLYVVYEA